jgi:hypothetical protein
MAATANTSGGISMCGLLTITFIVLKLCHVIDWSWWWVLSPVWAPLAAGLAFVGLFIGIGLLVNRFIK